MLGLGYGQTVDFSKERLIDLCTAYEKAINSIQIEFTYTAPPPDAETLEEWKKGTVGLCAGPTTNLFIAEKPFDKKFKIIKEYRIDDFRSGLSDVYFSRAYNGHIYKQLSMQNNHPPRGMILKENTVTPELFLIDPHTEMVHDPVLKEDLQTRINKLNP
jgi:hypothetical protein